MMWRIRSVLCLSIWLVAAVEGSQFRFDYRYSRKAQGWLKFHVMPTTFQEAFLKCKAEGAVLASPLHEDLRLAMVSLYKTTSKSCGIFTGIHATISKGDFCSVEGVPLSKIRVTWAPGEPENFSNKENCIVMVQNGTLADVNCDDAFPFICYRKKNGPAIITSCGTVDTEYNFNERTGSCYKFHRIGRSWRRAHMTCMAEGGHLAIVNSAVEAEVLKNLFAQNPSETIFAPHRDVASIGFYDWGERGVWYTVHGDTLQEAGYSSFGPNQPDNDRSFDGGSSCGGIFRDGLLDDIWCDSTQIPFICEKKVDSLVTDEDEHEL